MEDARRAILGHLTFERLTVPTAPRDEGEQRFPWTDLGDLTCEAKRAGGEQVQQQHDGRRGARE